MQCTKYTPKVETPKHLGSRVAEHASVRRRNEVEGGTSGKVLWGSMQAAAGMQTHPKVWTTSNKVDYPTRRCETVSPEEVRLRSTHMRTESICFGDDRTTMRKSIMQDLPREHYIGRLMHRRGTAHNKTKSELFVSPAEVDEWKNKHLVAMSHRQFIGKTSGSSRENEVSRKAIQRDMLASHFDVGFPEETRGETHCRAGSAGGSRADGFVRAEAVTAAATPKLAKTPFPPAAKAKGVASSVAIVDPNWKPLNSTTSSLYGASVSGVVRSQFAQRPNSAGPAFQPRQPDEGSQRATMHSKHSWKLGYDEGRMPNRYALSTLADYGKNVSFE